jgi:hypothetical protein
MFPASLILHVRPLLHHRCTCLLKHISHACSQWSTGPPRRPESATTTSSLAAGTSRWARRGTTPSTAGTRLSRRPTFLTPWGCARWWPSGAWVFTQTASSLPWPSLTCQRASPSPESCCARHQAVPLSQGSRRVSDPTPSVLMAPKYLWGQDVLSIEVFTCSSANRVQLKGRAGITRGRRLSVKSI